MANLVKTPKEGLFWDADTQYKHLRHYESNRSDLHYLFEHFARKENGDPWRTPEQLDEMSITEITDAMRVLTTAIYAGNA